MEKQTKNKKIKVIIILLSVLLALSLVALAAVLVRNNRSRSAPAAVSVPDNLITSETDAVSDIASSSEIGVLESTPESSKAQNTAESKKEEKKAAALSLYKGKAEENEPFNVGNMFPGDSETKYFRVKVSYNGTVMVRYRADVRPGYEKLAEVLKVKIMLLTTGEEMYDGLMRDMPQSVAYTLKSEKNTEDELYYEITAYLDTSVGNDYQYKDLIADFRWWVEETGNLIPPKTGDTSSVILWIAVAAASGLFTVILIFRRRREEEKNA